MLLARRVVKFLAWGLFVLVLLAAGATWFIYALLTDSDTAARLIKARAAQFLPGSMLDMGRVNIGLLHGEITVHHVSVLQRVDGRSFLTARMPWLSIRVDPRAALNGRFEPREVMVGQPTLRLYQRKDGTWNLQGLLADPWPAPAIENPPPIIIRNGKVELIGADRVMGGKEPATASPWRSNRRGQSGNPGIVTAQGPEMLPPGPVPGPSGPADAPGDGDAAPPGTPGDDGTVAPAEAPAEDSVAVLRDVALRIENAGNGLLHFEGTARSDLFDRLTLEGTIDPNTGETTLSGELAGLVLSENLHRRLPPQIRPPFEELALNRGEISLDLQRLAYHPGAPSDRRLEYDLQARLLGGAWECPHLPFPINDVSGLFILRDGLLKIEHAEGSQGNTIVRARGEVSLTESASGPFDLRIDLTQLELDHRLRERTPEQFAELWDVFKPSGEVDAYIHLVRHRSNGPVGAGATVLCRDVAATYRHFQYPLEHLSGQLTLEKQRLSVDLRCLIGERPARMVGTIDNPGPDAIVRLGIEGESIPIDDVFLKALPPDVRKVVDQFHPAGSVKARVQVFRKPLVGPRVKEEGFLKIDADLDLNPRCEITWTGLPYTVRNLTGRLELHPDLWIFKDMRGRNGQALIMGNGRVEKLPGALLPNGEPPLKIDLQIQAQNLPFNDDLRKSLQPAWQKTWSIINPTGSSDVDTVIHVEPGRPDVNHISIVPRPNSNVRLVVYRTPLPGVDQGGSFELRMENVGGRFEFDNGKVTMRDGHFYFHGAPVRFEVGDVMVEDSGRFALSVRDLWVKDIRLDSNLRKIMPPLMAQFAVRIDDGHPFTARGDLQIGWSGVAGEPAWCRWDRTRVVLIDNSLKAGIPLEHIQGQIDEVRGWSNGQALEVHGRVQLASVSLLGQQITEFVSPLHIEQGVARLDDMQARLLRGTISGSGSISLDNTPRFEATLQLAGAEIEEYARTLPGRQSFQGKLDAAVALKGLGTDVRSIQGKGEGHITQGDLGQLPFALSFVKFLNTKVSPIDSPRSSGKTAFDSADVEFRITNGEAILDPIKFTGSAFSLQGRGSRDPMGNLDLRLKVLYGRDRFHLPLISDVMREASGQFFIVHVLGTSSNPLYKLEALPQVQRLGIRRREKLED
jgi:hypothetical protein